MKAWSSLIQGMALVLTLGFSVGAGANTVVEKTIEVSTKEKNPVAARRILNQHAQSQVIEDMVKETIGEERFNKNKQVIENKVIKIAPKLIPFSKMGNLEATADGHKMTVMMKVNQDDLDKVLLENGLFFEADVQPLILPLVSWNDQVDGKSWTWWSPSEAPLLSKSNAILEDILRGAFLKHGFYLQRPQAINAGETVTAANVVPSLSEIQTLSNERGTQVVLTGEAKILPASRTGAYTLEVKMGVLHVPRNRTIAQVAGKTDTERGAKNVVVQNKLKELLETMGNDLAGQTLEAWRRGAAQSNFYKVILSGTIPLPVQEGFREAFKSKAREVKSIRERLVTAQGVTFEIRSVTGPKELAKRVGAIEVSGGKLVLKEVNDTELKYVMPAAKR